MPFSTESLIIGNLYTRPQLAKLWGYNSYQGFSKGVFTPVNQKIIVLFVTQLKQESLTQYNDFINFDHLHWEGEDGHGSDDRIANAHKRGEDIVLFYRDIHHTPFRYYGSIRINKFLRQSNKPSEFVFELMHDLSPSDDIFQAARELSNLTETEKSVIIKARLGQGRFREDLFEYWKGCAITNIKKPELLRASHIKPWRRSDNEERLNPFNGLLLLPQYDHLFDKGYISFDESGLLEPSTAISHLSEEFLGISFSTRLRNIHTDHLPFLEFHNQEVFVKQI
ncbi:MAG TPA: HNH endonuclease signature motif containing protein [Saprospiraceae bacterium]|nr:HNH endonuclease signature motif containing protein [Saprospiraceae bacterium]